MNVLSNGQKLTIARALIADDLLYYVSPDDGYSEIQDYGLLLQKTKKFTTLQEFQDFFDYCDGDLKLLEVISTL